MNRPGIQQYQEFFDENIILNFPHTSNDIIAAETFSKDLGAVRVRALRQKPTQMQTINAIKLLDALKSIHHNVCLFIVLFFVNGVPFLLTMSENIGLRTNELIPDRNSDFIITANQSATKMRTQHGFDVMFIERCL